MSPNLGNMIDCAAYGAPGTFRKELQDILRRYDTLEMSPGDAMRVEELSAVLGITMTSNLATLQRMVRSNGLRDPLGGLRSDININVPPVPFGATENRGF